MRFWVIAAIATAILGATSYLVRSFIIQYPDDSHTTTTAQVQENEAAAPSAEAQLLRAGPINSAPVRVEGRSTISGRVIDARGVPIQHADIRIPGSDEADSIDAQTDADGYYETPPLEPGWYEVIASYNDYSGGVTTIAPAGSSGVDFVLAAMGSIDGRVIDSRTGRPIERFRIGAHQPHGTYVRDTLKYKSIQDRDGRFALKDMRAGTQAISVFVHGYALATTPFPAIKSGENRHNVEIRMERGVDLEGRIVDPIGRPVRLAQIQVIGKTAERDNLDRWSDVSNDDGSFLLGSLPAGAVRLLVEHERYAPKVVTTNLSPSGRNEIRVALDEGAIIRGRLTYGKGATSGYVHAQSEFGAMRYGTVALDGRFEIRGVPEGSVVISANRNSYYPWHKHVHTVVENSRAPEISIDFAPRPFGHLEGTIFAAPGEPLRSPVTVVARALGDDKATEAQTGRTDSSGRFAMHLPVGMVNLAVLTGTPFARYVSVNVREGTTAQCDIHLFGGATMDVEVVAPHTAGKLGVWLLDGEPNTTGLTPDAMDTLLFTHIAGIADLDSHGRGAVKGIRPGSYTALAFAAERDVHTGKTIYTRWTTEKVTIRNEESVSITLDLN